MKTRKILFGIAVAASILCSCGTTSNLKGETPVMNAGKPEVIDYQGQSLGSPIPAWVVAVGEGNRNKISKSLGLDKDKQVFFLMRKGTDLDVIQLWTDNVDARAEVASSIEQTVAQAVNNELEAKQADEQTKERTTRIYTATLTNIALNGLMKEASYWVKTRTLKTGLKKASSDTDYIVGYTYYVVFGIDKNLYDYQLKKAMDDVPENDSETSFLKPLLTKKLEEQLLLPVETETYDTGSFPIEHVEDEDPSHGVSIDNVKVNF